MPVEYCRKDIACQVRLQNLSGRQRYFPETVAKPSDIEGARARVVGEITERLGISKSPTGLLKRMQWSAERPNASRTIANWFRGLNGPVFEDTMDMLDEAGLLQPEAVAVWRGVSLEAAELVVGAARAEAEAHLQAGPEPPAQRRRRSA